MTNEAPLHPLVVPGTSPDVVIPVTPTKGFLRSGIVQLILAANGVWILSFFTEHSQKIQEWMYILLPDGGDAYVPKIMQAIGMLLTAYAAWRRSQKLDTIGQPAFKGENWVAANAEALKLGRQIRFAKGAGISRKGDDD
jgi:hypothetical protein